MWYISLVALLALCHSACASWTDNLKADIRSVHIVPTLQLLKDVPQQPGPLYQTIELTDKSTYKLRVRTPSQEWWSPQFWSASLQSVVVKGRRKKGQPLIGMLMADSRHSMWDDSSERHLLFRHTEGQKEGMYLLPTAINLVYAVQQGYDFIHFQVPAEKMYRHSAWLKLVALRAMLPKYEYVLYLDSDTYVRPPGTPDLAQMLVRDGTLTAKQDKLIAVTKEDPRFPDVANTGVIMLRNASAALDMLEDWWLAVIRHPERAVLLKAWSFEQGAFTHVVYPQYKKFVSLLQLERYNSPEGEHICHVWSLLTDQERAERFFGAAAKLLQGLREGQEQGDTALAAEQLVKGTQDVLKAKAVGAQKTART